MNTTVRPRIIMLLCAICITLFFEAKTSGEAERKATVNTDTLEVHSKMSNVSRAVKSLNKGALVTVEFEIEGSDGAWCGVKEEGHEAILGYVQCQYLEREILQKKSWKSLGSSATKESDTRKPSQSEKVSPSPKLRHYSDIMVTLYMTSW